MRWLCCAIACLWACEGPSPAGWAEAENTGGPKVVWDIEALPLPEVPLPNNVATRLDAASPTGRFVNVSTQATTRHESKVRAKFNKMDGFGAYTPITVQFDAPIDLLDLHRRHANTDFRDDAVFLLNVDPACRRFGEEVALDLGHGRFPITLYSHGSRVPDDEAPDGYRINFAGNVLFPYDPEYMANNVLFNERNEDVNGDGVLNPGEDLDMDGVLDVPNFADPTACDGLDLGSLAYDRCVADNLLSYYERETNTLILRPLWPLEEQCTYAVVLSKRLVGEDGSPVMSPFPAVNHRDQTSDLDHASSMLGRYNLGLDDVAFAWTFTVGTMTKDLMSLRAGLYGSGPFAWMADTWPASGLRLWTRTELGAPFNVEPDDRVASDTWLPGACTGAAITELWGPGLDEWAPNMCAVEADLSAAGAFFGGVFDAPNLLVDGDGIATAAYPADNDESWRLDWVNGEVVAGSTEVTFWCSLPLEADDCTEGNPEGRPFCKPFPTVLYAHGYGSSRAEVSLHLGRHNQMGVAACALDSFGHGLNRWAVDPQASIAVRASIPAFQRYGVPELSGLLTLGRDRDLNNDGLPDGGMDQWTYDIFHTRDMVRQSSLEVMQFVRMLRSMDGTTRAADGRLLGDIDGDGVVDLGGPNVTIGAWGISLGGIIDGVLAGAEPSIDAISPNAGGGGLTDIGVRSTQGGVPDAVLGPIQGQFIMGCLPTDGRDNPLDVGESGGSDCWFGQGAPGASWQGGTLRLVMYNHDEARMRPLEFAAVQGVEPGDLVVVENLVNGEEAVARVNNRGWFRLGIAADALDAVHRRPILGLVGDDFGDVLVPDNLLVGDALRVRVYEGDGPQLRGEIDRFQHNITFQGSIYAEGTPLVALQEGYGHPRNSPDFRRLLNLAQSAIAPGDPAIWGQHAVLDPIDVPYDPHRVRGNTRLLMMPTLGDQVVPVNTGLAQGRTAGLFGSWQRDEGRPPEQGWRELFEPQERFDGDHVDAWLVRHHVPEGDWRLQRFPDNPINPNALFDPDNIADGTNDFGCGLPDWSAVIRENRCPPEVAGDGDVFFPVPRPPPGSELRLDFAAPGGGFHGFRVPMLRPAGQHGIYNAQPFRSFDADAYMVNFTIRFVASGGADVSHLSGCDCSASDLPNFVLDGDPVTPGLGRACTTSDMKVCDAECAQGWGLFTPSQATCAHGG